MAYTQAPVTCDNVTGVSIVPNTNCVKIILYEANQAGTADLVLTLGGGGSITRPAGERVELNVTPGSRFSSGVSIGTVKASAGSIQLGWEEY